jgi:glutamate/tyrosine decarboxylase-like PLP-dependent enzyme
MEDATVRALRRAATLAERYLVGIGSRPVAATASLGELRARLGGELGREGLDPVRVIDELAEAASGGLLGSAGGRFFAWVIGGSSPAALAADWLTSAWDQNAALYATGPAAAVAEEIAGGWLKDVLGLPAGASFAFTTGCQLAHFVCLAAARHATLRRAGWDIGEAGLFGAPRVKVLVGDQRHGSVDRALRFLGFGRANVVVLRTDETGRVEAEALERALIEDAAPAILVLGAADLNIGAFDDFARLVPMAKAAGAWVHVDGAFGLFARASASKRYLLEGVEEADSWATDAHKWLNAPFDNGLAFVRDPEAHRAAMTISAGYIAADKEARDQIDWNPEWSRRGRGFTVYAALRELGRGGLEDLVDRSCRFAAALVDGIGALPGARTLWRPVLNQGLVRFLDERPGATEADHDTRTEVAIAAINATGEAFFSPTSWRGMRAMRVSVVNWRTTAGDVDRAIAACAKALGATPRP